MSNKTSSPKGGKRGCLCDDGTTYSKDCCKGELINQGIGSLIEGNTTTIVETPNGRVITSNNN
jgi:hypothetical protein